MHYFAYCTLLDAQEMRRFVPGARMQHTGTIADWRVTFAAYAADRGGCHLEAEPGHVVHGV